MMSNTPMELGGESPAAPVGKNLISEVESPMKHHASAPFDRDHPAANILVLLDYLEAKQTPEHHFRGQTGFYATSVPSGMRHAVKGTSEDGQWVDLSDELGFDLPPRVRARASLKGVLLLVFGRVVGNMLAQQYGVSSDAYDITAESTMAAFFATRAYPSYEPFRAKDAGELGVIYRFTIKSKPPPFSVMEETLSWLYILEPSSGAKIWFDDVKSMLARVLKAEFRSRDEMQAYLDERFPDGYNFLELLKSAAYVPYELIEYAFLKVAAEMKFVDAEALIRSSRTHRQRGGLYFPPTMHRGFSPRQISLKPRKGRDFLAVPGAVETLGAAKVFNLNANPYVETFFFRHDAAKQIAAPSLRLIWPSADEDYLLALLIKLAEERLGHYFADFKTTPLDFDLGLIDPGYRSGP
ncbi:MAG TPA: hypothetical protein VHQ90_19510 [Thermoanaerobaculia bacterium]|nr:hypothetical protein [Thermoanaerobaculia bacterium]